MNQLNILFKFKIRMDISFSSFVIAIFLEIEIKMMKYIHMRCFWWRMRSMTSVNKLVSLM